MRLTLAMPPVASPTYLPLGLSTLAAHLRTTRPDTELSIHDLSIDAWESLAAAEPGGAAMMRFHRGQGGPFHDERLYDTHRAAWSRVAELLRRLTAEARGICEGRAAADTRVGPLLQGWVRSLLATDPELVGLSIPYPDQLPWGVALARVLRESLPAGGRGPLIVVGGSALSALRVEELVAFAPWVDAAALGEGEAILEALVDRRPLPAIPGLVTRTDGGGVHRHPRGHPLPAADLPAADFSDLALGRYFWPEPVFPLAASRNCLWRRCRFCVHNASFAGYRRKSAEKVADQVEGLRARYGARHVYMTDQYVDAADLEAITDALAERRLDVALHCMGRPTADYTAERLARIGAGGCRWISWGVETGSQRLLDLCDKGTRVADVERALFDAHDAGISNLLMMIFGLPGGDAEALQETFALLERTHGVTAAMTASAFVLFETSRFGRAPAAFGLVPGKAEVLLGTDAYGVRSSRREFLELDASGATHPPRGQSEVDQWRMRRRWLGPPPFLETVPAEHYLILADRLYRARGAPPVPATPGHRAA